MFESSLEAIRSLESEFTGHISGAHDAPVPLLGDARVLIPHSVEDVERALRLVRASGRSLSVVSGRRVSHLDPTLGSAAAPAALLSMESMSGFEREGQRLSLGPALTVGELARSLRDIQVLLPLPDDALQSMASAVLGQRSSAFPRSGPPLLLRELVVEAQVVPTRGEGAGLAQLLSGEALAALLAGERGDVITRLSLDLSRLPAEEDRWALGWMVNFRRKGMQVLLDALFGGSAPIDGVDLSLRISSSAHGLPVALLRATGRGAESEAALVELVRAALRRARLEHIDGERASGAGPSLEIWVNLGPNPAEPEEQPYRFGSAQDPRPYAEQVVLFLDAAEGLLHSGATSTSLPVWLELQPDAHGLLWGRASLSTAELDQSQLDRAIALLAPFAPLDREPEAPPLPAAEPAANLRTTLRAAMVLPEQEPTGGFDLMRSNRATADRIPGFRGDVFIASDGYSYRKAIQQYAVSSYSEEVVCARMTPRLVARPVDGADVAVAVNHAAAQGWKVVARSGGHQYCGLSSGGDDTLLLDMTRLSSVNFSAGAQQVTVGPGLALRDLSRALRDRNRTIPHGECPLVRIGGHVQSGGIGHQLRSLGATLDWVRSFKLVTRTPGQAGFSEQVFRRPTEGPGPAQPDSSDVFRALLGGGPGAWGVLTEITFDLLPDSAWPTSGGYSWAFVYPFAKEAAVEAFEQLGAWAERQAAGSLQPGVDLFISVISGDLWQARPPVLLLETMSRDAAGMSVIKEAVDSVRGKAGLAPVRLINGPKPLSQIADQGVRRIGVAGLPSSGREFDLPYKKSLHITRQPFSADFAQRFMELVDRTWQSDGLKVVVQTVVGGGEFLANGQRGTTHMQRRDALVQLVYDVFYKPGHEQAAEQLQLEMKALLASYSGGQDLRMAWGTFEDPGAGDSQLDMSRSAVQRLYYDSPAELQRLQAIKAWTDPTDLFHTTFTVRPSGA